MRSARRTCRPAARGSGARLRVCRRLHGGDPACGGDAPERAGGDRPERQVPDPRARLPLPSARSGDVRHQEPEMARADCPDRSPRGWLLAAARLDGYWVVRTESRIDTPHEAAAGEPTWIAGIAWAGLRGIAGVEVSTDGGRSWQRAQVQRPLSPYAWTRWAYRWTPQRAGRHELVCRATDGGGRLQDAASRPPHPAGASGYHRRALEVT